MKKHEIFTFTAPNRVEVTAVVVDKLNSTYDELEDSMYVEYLCYAQNKLFTYHEQIGRKNPYTPEEEEYTIKEGFGRIVIDYCILPDYDDMLETEQQMFDDDCYEALGSIEDTEF